MARRSSPHNIITSRKAPKPLGPYPHAIRVEQAGAMLFVSQQFPVEVPSGKVFAGDIRRQAEIAIGHVRNIALDAGFSADEIVKCTVYLTDLKHLEKVTAAYQKAFVGQSPPALTIVQVAGLPNEVGVCVDGVAVKKAESADQMLDDAYGPGPEY